MKKSYIALQKVHSYKIAQLNGCDGRWQTYVKDDGKKKQIKANTKDELYSKLFEYYSINDETYTVESYFDKVWYPWKSSIIRKRETILQYKQHFDKYVRTSPLAKMDISRVRTKDIENFSNTTLINNDLTSHNWNTKMIPLKGVFELAVKNEDIKSNPWKDVSIQWNLFRSKRQKAPKEKIFYLDEVKMILNESKQQYYKNHNCANLAIILNFELGLRIGELSALKYTDFDFTTNEVYIQRQESDGEVEPYVKRDAACGYRTLQLSDNAIRIIAELHSHDNGEYLICKDGQRMTERQIERRLELTEKKLGIFSKLKCSHCIRRTVASIMAANGTPIDEIRRWLGHNDEKTTYGYIYNIYREDEMAEMHRKNSILTKFSVS